MSNPLIRLEDLSKAIDSIAEVFWENVDRIDKGLDDSAQSKLLKTVVNGHNVTAKFKYETIKAIISQQKINVILQEIEILEDEEMLASDCVIDETITINKGNRIKVDLELLGFDGVQKEYDQYVSNWELYENSYKNQMYISQGTFSNGTSYLNEVDTRYKGEYVLKLISTGVDDSGVSTCYKKIIIKE